MSVSKWRYTEQCDEDYCCGDCDNCPKDGQDAEDLTEDVKRNVCGADMRGETNG